jgi:hypothetical protein
MQVCLNAWLNHGVFPGDTIQDGLAQGYIHEALDDGTLAFAFGQGSEFVDWALRAGVPLTRLQVGIQTEFDPTPDGPDLAGRAGRACLNTMLYVPLLSPEMIADGVSRGYLTFGTNPTGGQFNFSVGAPLYEWGESVQLAEIEQAVVDALE